MTTLRDPRIRTLTWYRPKLTRRTFELRAGEERGEVADKQDVLATLRWESSWRSIALAETSGASWRFQRRGVWRPRVEVADGASGALVATFAGTWSGRGTLPLADGRV